MSNIFEKLTHQMTEAIESAISLALHNKNSEVEPIHFLWALLSNSGSVLNQAFNKMNRITSYNVCYTKLLRVIPVVNLAKWMGVETPKTITTKNTRVIITEFNNILIGFVVHDAKRIRRINWKDIEPASFASGSGALDGRKITGVTRIEDDSVITSYSIHYTKLYD